MITEDTSVTDSVWLLTRADYINLSYGFSTSTSTYGTARLCSPSDFAIANFARTYVSTSYTTPARQNGGTAVYWTSSATFASYYAYNVNYNGSINSYTVDTESDAARPVLLFNL